MLNFSTSFKFTGVGVTCLSYFDKLNIAVSIDKNILPCDISIKSIMEKILEEFNILYETPAATSIKFC